MNCNTTHYRANSSSVPGDPTAGGIAHDFNNILTAIMGNLTLAILDVPDSPEAVERLRDAEKATLRARDLTQQLLTFSKGGEPVRAAVQLDAIIRDVANFALHGSGTRAIFAIAAGLWPADVDRGQIARVVQNLVLNAVQAMPGGGTIRLEAANEEVAAPGRPGLAPGSYVRLTVADTGQGMSADILERIFDPYFTTKDSGSGLGLAAVYSIVKKHQGAIDVESEPGRGATFRLWLPALREAPAAPDGPAPARSTTWTGRVLFMDDEEIIRTMAGGLLERLGFDVDCVADGTEMVARYEAAMREGKPYALVIMDLTVPGGMGGREGIKRLREIDPTVKAIVSSGYSSDPILANHRAHGFAGVVAKPYVISELLRTLRSVLKPG